MSEDEEEAFEREYGVPVHAGGSLVVARWGMGLAILFAGIMFSGFLLSYFYLRLDAESWPPSRTPEPGLVLAAAAAALVVASGLTMHRALQRMARGERSGFQAAVLGALTLAAGAVAVQIRDLAGFDFGWTDHAYGSIVYALAGFCIAVLVAASIMAAMALFWSSRGYFSARRLTTPLNMVRFWTAAVAFWVVGFGTLYLGPLLT